MTKVLISIFMFIFMCENPRALTINGLYGDLSPTSSYVENLICVASNYDSFIDSDYVVFRNEQYQYYIVWGDLTFNNNKVTGENVEMIDYTRDSSNNYYYNYSSDPNVNLSFDKLVVSNIQGVGAKSLLYDDFKTNYNNTLLLTMSTSALLVLLFINLRKG